jgi:hypothetical protein
MLLLNGLFGDTMVQNMLLRPKVSDDSCLSTKHLEFTEARS